MPARDDDWNFHLNLRKGADGAMEFLKRPVAEYLVPVPGLEHVPSDHPVAPVQQPPLFGGKAPASVVSRVAAEPAPPPSPRIAAVLALEEPALAQLAEFLTDPDPGVRRTAVATLVENLPDGYGPAKPFIETEGGGQ